MSSEFRKLDSDPKHHTGHVVLEGKVVLGANGKPAEIEYDKYYELAPQAGKLEAWAKAQAKKKAAPAEPADEGADGGEAADGGK